MNRALGMFESQNEAVALACAAQSSDAPANQMGDAGGARWRIRLVHAASGSRRQSA